MQRTFGHDQFGMMSSTADHSPPLGRQVSATVWALHLVLLYGLAQIGPSQIPQFNYPIPRLPNHPIECLSCATMTRFEGGRCAAEWSSWPDWWVSSVAHPGCTPRRPHRTRRFTADFSLGT